MGKETNFVNVALRTSPTVNIHSSGVDVPQVLDSNIIQGIDFKVSVEDIDWNYASATDKVYINGINGFSKELTRVGDYFRYTVSPLDFHSGSVAPGSTFTTSAFIVIVRTDTGVSTSLRSKSFPLNLLRERRFVPTQISGCLFWISAYGTGSTATLIDKTLNGYDLTGTSSVSISSLPNGVPLIKGNGTTTKYDSVKDFLDTPISVVGLCKLESVDGTDRCVLKVGGTNGLRVIVTSTELIGKINATEAITAAPGTEKPFVFIATYNQTAVTIQINDVTLVSTNVSDNMTAGILSLFDSSEDDFAAAGFVEVFGYNKILSDDEKTLCIKGLMAEAGI